MGRGQKLGATRFQQPTSWRGNRSGFAVVFPSAATAVLHLRGILNKRTKCNSTFHAEQRTESASSVLFILLRIFFAGRSCIIIYK